MALGKRQKAFIAFAALEALTLIIDSAIRLQPDANVEGNWFLGILIIAVSSFFYLCVECVTTENKFGLITFECAAAFVTGREILDYIDPSTDTGLLRLSLVCVAQLFWVVAGYHIYGQMGWIFFHKIGSDVVLKKCFTNYQTFFALIKLDFEFQFLLIYTGLYYIVIYNTSLARVMGNHTSLLLSSLHLSLILTYIPPLSPTCPTHTLPLQSSHHT